MKENKRERSCHWKFFLEENSNIPNMNDFQLFQENEIEFTGKKNSENFQDVLQRVRKRKLKLEG